MSAYAVLHDRCLPIWRLSADNPMVRAIGDGSLPREVFRYYFEQNILYLRDYARAIALVAANAPDEEAADILSRFLRSESERELPKNHRFLERLGGDPSGLSPYHMNSANYGYTRHLLSVAAMGDCADGLAAVLPCPCGYTEFAGSMVRDLPDDPLYAEWIRFFGEGEDDGILNEMTGLLDRLVDVADGERMLRLDWIFRVSSLYEVMFWDAAYSMGKGDPFSS